jgi:putative RecB family exonuclease
MTIEAIRTLETLSPSRAGDFKTCPQLFKFRAIDRLPSRPRPPGAGHHRSSRAAAPLRPSPKATSVPRPALRPVPGGLDRDAGGEEYSALFESTEDERTWGVESMRLLANYFSIEDPGSIEPLHREYDMLEDLDGIVIRGILDRIDRVPMAGCHHRLQDRQGAPGAVRPPPSSLSRSMPS